MHESVVQSLANSWSKDLRSNGPELHESLDQRYKKSHELTEGEIWNLYMTLTRVENAFRSLKSDLGLRPVYHQLATRTAAHLFISVLGYHLLSAIELTLRSNDDTRSWSTIKEQVSTHARTTMVLTSDEGIVNHIRVSSVPEPTQRKIYSLLGVRDPLKRIKTIATRL